MDNETKVWVWFVVFIALVVGPVTLAGLNFQSTKVTQCDTVGGTLVKTVDGYQCPPIKPIAVSGR